MISTGWRTMMMVCWICFVAIWGVAGVVKATTIPVEDDILLADDPDLSSDLIDAARRAQASVPLQVSSWTRAILDLISQDDIHVAFAIKLMADLANAQPSTSLPFQVVSLSSAEFRVDATCTSAMRSCSVVKKVRIASQWCEVRAPGLFGSSFTTGTIENIQGFVVTNSEQCDDCPSCFALLTSGSSPEPPLTARLQDQNTWTIRLMVNPTFPLSTEKVKKLEPFIGRVITQASQGLVTSFAMDIVTLSSDSRCARVNCFMPGSATKSYLTTILLGQQDDSQPYDALSVAVGGTKAVIRVRPQKSDARESTVLRTALLAAILMNKGLIPHESRSMSVDDSWDYSSGAIGLSFSPSTQLSTLPRLKLGWMQSQNILTIDLWGTENSLASIPPGPIILYDSSSLALPTTIIIKFRAEGFLLVEYESSLKTVFVRRLLASSGDPQETLFALSASMPQLLMATLKGQGSTFRFGSNAIQLVDTSKAKASLRVFTCSVPPSCVPFPSSSSSGMCLDDATLTRNGTGWCYTSNTLKDRQDCWTDCPDTIPQMRTPGGKQKRTKISQDDVDGYVSDGEEGEVAKSSSSGNPLQTALGAIVTIGFVALVAGLAIRYQRRKRLLTTSRKTSPSPVESDSDSSSRRSPPTAASAWTKDEENPGTPSSPRNVTSSITPSTSASRRSSGGFMDIVQSVGRRMTGDLHGGRSRRVSLEPESSLAGNSLLSETEPVNRSPKEYFSTNDGSSTYLESAGRRNPYTPTSSKRGSLSDIMEGLFFGASASTSKAAAARRATSLASDVSHQRGLRRYASAQQPELKPFPEEEPFVTGGGSFARRMSAVESSDEGEGDDDDEAELMEVGDEFDVKGDTMNAMKPPSSTSWASFERRKLARRQTAGI